MNVTNIKDRSVQGVTQPFLCTCEDGYDYYVKGSFAGFRSQICEWIGSNLAIELGLPVPPPKIVEVPKSLIEFGVRADLKDLGAGHWFASRRIENVIEMPYDARCKVPETLRATMLLFDWWILNPDRTLGEWGGNPNLLWDAHGSQFHVIDQNNSFNPSAELSFWDDHIFRNDRRMWTPAFKMESEPLLQRAESKVEEWWNEMPIDWYDEVPSLEYDEVKTVLARKDTQEFWRSA